MNTTTPADRLKKARIDLLLDQPFFGSLMMQLKPLASKSYDTFATDGRVLYYNADYMATLDDGQLRTILAHEVMHAALLHPYRVGNRDLEVANQAADYTVNNFLERCNEAAKAALDPIPFPFWKGALLNPRFDNMGFEEIYSDLQRQPKGDKPGGGESEGTSGGAGKGKGKSGGKSKSAPDGSPSPGGEGRGEGEPSPSNQPGEFTKGPADEATAQEDECNWKVALKQAAMLAKGQGRLPGEMERLINELLDPKAPWREILRNLLTSHASDDYTWTRPNRRYGGRGFVMPSLHSPRMGPIAVAIDTSGSVDQKQLDEFMAEIRAILFDCRPEKLILIQCDATIHEWTECDPFDDLNVTLKGGGGTDFCPVFQRLAEEFAGGGTPPAALVYLTDLMGTFPDEAPAYPVIWACNNERQAPFGETVNI